LKSNFDGAKLQLKKSRTPIVWQESQAIGAFYLPDFRMNFAPKRDFT
jgi:hypothetical protein